MKLRSLKAILRGAAYPKASFPEELQALLRWHDGEDDGMCGALEQNWHLMSAAQIDGPIPAINVGSGTGTRIIDLARRIARLAPGPSRVRLMPARQWT